jgi:deoxyribonuclease IV
MKRCASNPHACAEDGITRAAAAISRMQERRIPRFYAAAGASAWRALQCCPMRIGAHMSIAGSLARSVDRALVHGCEALQIFTKNASQWLGKPLDPADVRTFRVRIANTGIAPVVSHASYLINLATTTPALREQSIAAFADEIDRAHALGLLGVVVHPGTCTAGTEDDALRLVAKAIRRAFAARPRRRTMVLLEHTAGQGRTLGYRFEHLAAIVGHMDGSARIGICLDTCHLSASGYDIATAHGYEDTFAQFDRIVGLDRLKVFHANDSKRPCGSRVDRHEHIGRGCLGEEPFRRILHDPRFAHLAMLIETEKSTRTERAGAVVADPLDTMNLATLRRLREKA